MTASMAVAVTALPPLSVGSVLAVTDSACSWTSPDESVTASTPLDVAVKAVTSIGPTSTGERDRWTAIAMLSHNDDVAAASVAPLAVTEAGEAGPPAELGEPAGEDENGENEE